jgi:hypothetical protein
LDFEGGWSEVEEHASIIPTVIQVGADLSDPPAKNGTIPGGRRRGGQCNLFSNGELRRTEANRSVGKSAKVVDSPRLSPQTRIGKSSS